MGLFDDMMMGGEIAKSMFRGVRGTFRFIKKHSPKAVKFTKDATNKIANTVNTQGKKLGQEVKKKVDDYGEILDK